MEYPPLTISSENLADDEREDTSDGEIEPEPDYDDDSYSGKYRSFDAFVTNGLADYYHLDEFTFNFRGNRIYFSKQTV